MKKTKNNLGLILILAVLLTAITCLSGCNLGHNKKVRSYADLIAIRVNNCMADWENPDFNLNYEGSNKLTVKVPYTNQFKITDLILSKEAESKVYSDVNKSKEVGTNTVFQFYSEQTILFVSVNNKKASNSYEIHITVDNAIIPDGYTEKDIPLNNPDGHIWIPEDVQQMTLDGKIFNVVRNQQDLEKISVGITDYKPTDSESTKYNNYIMANDITLSNFLGIGLKDKGLPLHPSSSTYEKFSFNGIYDGNNYQLIYNSTLKMRDGFTHNPFIYEISNGGIKNVIITTDRDQKIYHSSLLDTLSGSFLSNCVNKINIESKDSKESHRQKIGSLVSYIQGVTPKMHNAINYGNITINNTRLEKVGGLVGYIGTIDNSVLKSKVLTNCVNLGNINYKSSETIPEYVDIGGVVGYYRLHQEEQNLLLINLGEVKAKAKKENYQETLQSNINYDYEKINKNLIKYYS